MDPDDPLLDTLRAAGTRDADGAFSIDVVRARAKLERFQLADPSLWAVLMVTAAVAGGASAIDFHPTWMDAWTGMKVTFDGLPADIPRIDQVVRTLVGGDERDNDFAAALHALSGLGPRSIVLEASGRRLLIDGKGQRVENAERPQSGTSLRIAGVEFSGRERKAIERFCAFAPLLITFDMTGIDPWFVVRNPLVVRMVGGHPERVLKALHIHVVAPRVVQQADGPYAAVLAYRPHVHGDFHSAAPLESSPREWDGHGLTVLVLHGQSFEIRHGQASNTLFVADAKGLQKDLSQTVLVDEPALPQRLAWLSREFERMALELADALGDLSPDDRGQAAGLLEAVAERLATRPDEVHGAARCKLLRCRADVLVEHGGGDDPKVLDAIDRAVASVAQFPEPRAQRHLTSVIEAWQRKVLAQWDQEDVGRLRDRLYMSKDWLSRVDVDNRGLGPIEEVLALLAHLTDDHAAALNRSGQAYAHVAEGASPERLARVIDQTALLYRVGGDIEKAAALHERARTLHRDTASAIVQADLAFAEGRIEDVLRIGRGVLADVAQPDRACVALLDTLVDALRLSHDEARAVSCCELALGLWSASHTTDLEQVERLELLAELVASARRAGSRPRPGLTRAMGAWLRARHARWTVRLRAADDERQGKSGELALRITRMLSGCLDGTRADRGIAACEEALALLDGEHRPHLSVRIGTLWLAVRLFRFRRRFVEADALAARLHLATMLADRLSEEC